ncbi:unnamed protein product [Owenia fusiformis]|uniref:Pyridine nucleotide-disulfide oxidoreductase domain-containing protein 2 n=1 Tax=Owenia fusiformis TaxID=6347 RepID=A0A8J1T589_OWEFU|nr:unnamed protein product [Owenia fusiformis]
MAASCCPSHLHTWKKLGIFSARLKKIKKFSTTSNSNANHGGGTLKSKYDAVIIGGGHNGLVAAAYMQKAGLDVCVLERRHVIGGAAVTEEMVPGFKFSRASYVLSLLRPQIHDELELKKHGLKVHLRDPNSFTPLRDPGPDGKYKSLTLGRDEKLTAESIAQFSVKDAQNYAKYEEWLNELVVAIDPLLDNMPISPVHARSMREKIDMLPAIKALTMTGRLLGKNIPGFYELLTAPASKVLGKWFESEPLIATLATDGVIGAMISPDTPGSGYVLLHHVMGELEGIKGAWGYAEGGMGAVSQAIANSAQSHGASIFTEKAVDRIVTDADNQATGVVLIDGTEVKADIVMSNATPKITFLDLLEKNSLPEEFINEVSAIDYTSPVTKINVAVNKLPNFLAKPNIGTEPMPHHRATIHMNCENTSLVMDSYRDAVDKGIPSKRPMIEMTIPSSLDKTIAPPGCHVVLLFTQYTPYSLPGGETWTDERRNQYADTVFDCIEEYAPGFKESVVGRDILTPPDLEKTFGLTGGNIFHGGMALDQLYMCRPVPSYCNYRSPIKGLYLCGSGTHPGGGVMGSPGRLAALAAVKDN